MQEIKTIFSELEKAIGIWNEIPSDFWKILWPLLLMTLSSYPIVVCVKQLENKFTNIVDRLLLSLFIGLGYYTFLFALLNALFEFPINKISFYIIFSLTFLTGLFIIYTKKTNWRISWDRKTWYLLIGIFIVFFISGYSRYQNTLMYPDQLLDSDPYRHYPRTESIVQTGNISKYEPYLIGEVPIFEVQGCYVLAAILSSVSSVDSWQIWKYGSILMGIFSILSFYLFSAYFLPGRPSHFVGIISSLLLAGFSVHITRTKMGFSEAWAFPFLPLSYLMLLWSFRYNSILFGSLFGIFLLFVGLSNMVPVSISVVFIFVYCLYELIKRCWKFYYLRKTNLTYKVFRPFWGLLLGTFIFMTFIFIWQSTYAGASMKSISAGSSFENRSIMQNVISREESKEKNRAQKDKNIGLIYKFLGENIGWHNTMILDRYLDIDKLIYGILFFVFFLLIPFKDIAFLKSDSLQLKIDEGMWKDTKVFLLIILFVPLAHYCMLKYFMRPNTLEQNDLKNTPSILNKLKSDEPIIIDYLYPLLPSSFKASLNKYETNDPIPTDLQSDLLLEFNNIIQRNFLFNESKGIPSDLNILRSKTRKLIEHVQIGDDISYINRLIIEDFFPNEIEKRDLFGFLRVPTFTGRTYRYLIIPAMSISLSIALSLYLIMKIVPTNLCFLLTLLNKIKNSEYNNAINKSGPIIRNSLIVLIFLFFSNQALFSKGYGHWPPTPKQYEKKAYLWLSSNMPSGSKIFAYWFEADYIGAYSFREGNPLSSILAGNRTRTGIRSNMWPPIEIDNLKIPNIRSLNDIKKYTKENPGNYYVYKGRYGPYLDFDNDALFNLIATFEDKKLGDIEVYELNTNNLLIDKNNYRINE